MTSKGKASNSRACCAAGQACHSSLAAVALCLLMLMTSVTAAAQHKKKGMERDSVPLFCGVAVSMDLVGPIQKATGDYGQMEGAVRVNLKDKYFPVFEMGYGKTDYTSVTSEMRYTTAAPYYKIGIDFNMMKNKHDIYKVFGGLRYAFTNFSYDAYCYSVADPIWGYESDYVEEGVECRYTWMELVFGVDAKMWGPVHLGWSVRYRSRLSYDNGRLGGSWYVPGFGKNNNSMLGGTFHIAIDI